MLLRETQSHSLHGLVQILRNNWIKTEKITVLKNSLKTCFISLF